MNVLDVLDKTKYFIGGREVSLETKLKEHEQQRRDGYGNKRGK